MRAKDKQEEPNTPSLDRTNLDKISYCNTGYIDVAKTEFDKYYYFIFAAEEYRHQLQHEKIEESYVRK